MNSIKFAKIDYMKTKSQSKVLLLFLVVAVFVGMNMDTFYWSIVYVAFGGLLMVTTPFLNEILAERGFFVLLPARAGSRIRGRYLFGSSYLLVCCICGAIISAGICICRGYELDNFLQINLIIFSSVLFFNAIQFLVFSFLKVKNAQVLSIIRMVVPFILFFGGNSILELIMGESQELSTTLMNIVNDFQENITMVACIMLGMSILVTIVCCEISVWKEERKEA